MKKTKEEIISNLELKSKILSLTDSLSKSISLVVNDKIMDINEIIKKAKFSGFSFNLFDAKIIIDENAQRITKSNTIKRIFNIDFIPKLAKSVTLRNVKV